MDCHAMRRLGQVEEVSKVVSFLASAKAAYTTGAMVFISGGRHCMAYSMDRQ